jgi:hypothetical protein
MECGVLLHGGMKNRRRVVQVHPAPPRGGRLVVRTLGFHPSNRSLILRRPIKCQILVEVMESSII